MKAFKRHSEKTSKRGEFVNEDLFLENANKYKQMVYRIALNYLANPYDADDIVQDTFLKFYLYKSPFQSDEHIRNWLIRVTINLCKNELRKPFRKSNIPLDELSASIPFEHEEQSKLFESVMSLPEKHRVVLYLFYYEGLSVKEIAEMLKLNESAVTSRLSRGRKQLKLELTGGACYA